MANNNPPGQPTSSRTTTSLPPPTSTSPRLDQPPPPPLQTSNNALNNNIAEEDQQIVYTWNDSAAANRRRQHLQHRRRNNLRADLPLSFFQNSQSDEDEDDEEEEEEVASSSSTVDAEDFIENDFIAGEEDQQEGVPSPPATSTATTSHAPSTATASAAAAPSTSSNNNIRLNNNDVHLTSTSSSSSSSEEDNNDDATTAPTASPPAIFLLPPKKSPTLPASLNTLSTSQLTSSTSSPSAFPAPTTTIFLDSKPHLTSPSVTANILTSLRHPTSSFPRQDDQSSSSMSPTDSPLPSFLLHHTTHHSNNPLPLTHNDPAVFGRFFKAGTINLSQFLQKWLQVGGATPVLTLNKQIGSAKINYGSSWAHQICCGVTIKEDSSVTVHLTNPQEDLSMDDLLPQVMGESVLYVRREDVLRRVFYSDGGVFDLRALARMQGGGSRWGEVNVLGQVSNLLLEEYYLKNGPTTPTTNNNAQQPPPSNKPTPHIAIPVSCVGGVTVFAIRNSAAFEDLLLE